MLHFHGSLMLTAWKVGVWLRQAQIISLHKDHELGFLLLFLESSFIFIVSVTSIYFKFSLQTLGFPSS